MVCEATGLDADRIIYVNAETNLAPESGTTAGSRQTLITGEAACRACAKLMEDMQGKDLADLNGKEYLSLIHI